MIEGSPNRNAMEHAVGYRGGTQRGIEQECHGGGTELCKLSS